MKIKVLLKNTDPTFFENLLPIMSDELIMQINKRKKHFIISQSEYNELLTELSAIKNHSEEYSSIFQLEIEQAIIDFTTGWSYIFE